MHRHRSWKVLDLLQKSSHNPPCILSVVYALLLLVLLLLLLLLLLFLLLPLTTSFSLHTSQCSGVEADVGTDRGVVIASLRNLSHESIEIDIRYTRGYGVRIRRVTQSKVKRQKKKMKRKKKKKKKE